MGENRGLHPKNLRAIFKKLSMREHQPVIVRESSMRSLLIIASALFAFGAAMTIDATTAHAVVCADGVVRAGCAGPRGAVVVRKPVKVCKTTIVNGVKVRRCT
jgi:hypothetical protein